MPDDRSAHEERLVELLRQVLSLPDTRCGSLLGRVREEDEALADDLTRLLDDLLGAPPAVGAATLRARREDPPDETLDVLRRLTQRVEGFRRYRLEEEVARGGQGVVRRVWDEDLRRSLAMKISLARGAGGDGHADSERRNLERFLDEAQVTGQLDHPGVVPVHELGLDDRGRPYFTMKLVRGQDLRRVFELAAREAEGWSRARALGVVLKVCEAMAYAHSKGVIHRDLKPSNVMVGRFGEVYVMDWGLARVLGRADPRDLRVHEPQPASVVLTERAAATTPDSPLLTLDGEVVGTPAYMSPEQALGRVEAMGPHTDVYAVGAMLYHLLCGHMPYVPTGTRLSSFEVWRLVQQGPPRPITAEAPAAPAELVAICEKAMEREASRRYRDMSELAEDLRAFVEGRVVRAYETGALPELRKWVARNRRLSAAVGVALLALLGGLVTSLALKARSDRHFALAEERRREAEARRDEVLRLSALQDVEDLLAESDGLWPPLPPSVPRFEDWIERASRLVDQLPLHRSRLQELRATALGAAEAPAGPAPQPSSAAGQRADVEGRIAFLERALARRREGRDVELPDARGAEVPTSAGPLCDLAWPLVKPDRGRFGEEPLGLALALRAIDLADEEQQSECAVLIAWASLALGRDDEARAAARDAVELAAPARRAEFEQEAQRIGQAASHAGSEEALRAAERELEELRTRRAELAADAEGRRWRFPDSEPQARWWSSQLAKLVGELERLQSDLLDEAALSPEHGWSVARRLAFARELEREHAPGGAWARAWERDLAAIRAAYPGAEVTAQLDLVPLGPDPGSGLWEFAHLPSGSAPRRDPASGKLLLDEDSGVVLVLLPGGTFTMGAQAGDPAGPNYDLFAKEGEGPVHLVSLPAFFLSKYELSQSQWRRLCGSNPSGYQPRQGPADRGAGALWVESEMHPVEQVTWTEARRACRRVGLDLPTEAQWEYGARGGTDTAWWTGSSRESLLEPLAANLADRSGGRAGVQQTAVQDWPELDDGHTVHAPVDGYAPNPFGLHGVHGNVWEYCLDGFDARFYQRSPLREPLCDPESSRFRVMRGGSYYYSVDFSRCAFRAFTPPDDADGNIGLRPARAL